MVCAKLDSELTKLARKFRSRYTRYADDITFSRDEVTFPLALASREEGVSPRVTTIGVQLRTSIEQNGFIINDAKIRLRRTDERQEVTGLIVNDFPNVDRKFRSRLRAMLHSWKIDELDAAQEKFREHDLKDRGPYRKSPKFQKVVKGHIDYLGMVRGSDNPRYLRHLEEYASLTPGFRIRPAARKRRNHLQTYRDAIWVLESVMEDCEGTAFHLDTVGLVTCAHVVRRDDGELCEEMIAYQPRNRTVEYPVRVLAIDDDRDLALIAIDTPLGHALIPKYTTAPLPNGTRVHVAGYPAHGVGASLWEVWGAIAQYRHHAAAPHYVVDCPIVGGASGAPVMDRAGAAIGIASRGSASFLATTEVPASPQEAKRYGVVPISQIRHLQEQSILNSIGEIIVSEAP